MKNCIGKELSKIPMPVRSSNTHSGHTVAALSMVFISLLVINHPFKLDCVVLAMDPSIFPDHLESVAYF